jgi:two-component system CheB/CheR fusion protein
MQVRNGTPWLCVDWSETEGPVVRKPKSAGLGTRLITGGVPGARVKHDFLPTGVVCHIEFPLDRGGPA